jgi:TPR repeat protein
MTLTISPLSARLTPRAQAPVFGKQALAPEQSVAELEALVQTGDDNARLALDLRRKGKSTVSSQYLGAVRHLANRGMAVQQNNLGIFLMMNGAPDGLKGLGMSLFHIKVNPVPKDLVEAVKWFTLAARNKNRGEHTMFPESHLNMLAAILPKDQYEAGHRQAMRFERTD